MANKNLMVLNVSEEEKAIFKKVAKEEMRTLTAFVVNGLNQYIKNKGVNK